MGQRSRGASTLVEELTSLRGVGDWTAGYVAMRAIGDPDVFERGRVDTGSTSPYPIVASLDETAGLDAKWMLLDRPFPAQVVPLGRVSIDAGRETLDPPQPLLDPGRYPPFQDLIERLEPFPPLRLRLSNQSRYLPLRPLLPAGFLVKPVGVFSGAQLGVEGDVDHLAFPSFQLDPIGTAPHLRIIASGAEPEILTRLFAGRGPGT